jgi:predicted AAA+ superfamily ATPase
MDVGLASNFIGLDSNEIRKIYFDPPSDLILLHKGMISEQFVGQSLLFNEINEKGEIFYWLRDESTQKAEVDYVIEKGLNIIPIEVKAGKTDSIRSLIQFAKEKNSKFLVKFGTQNPSGRTLEMERKIVKVFELPLYWSEHLRLMSWS